jgi:hypothetical protein
MAAAYAEVIHQLGLQQQQQQKPYRVMLAAAEGDS